MSAKIYNASPGFGDAMTRSEIDSFLAKSKLNLQLGTVDEKDEPMIHTTWFYCMNGKLYVETSKGSKKAANIRRKNVIYFCIDDETVPYKGVRGKGDARLIEDVKETIPIAENIMIKYTGSLDNQIAMLLMDAVKAGLSVIIEITPRYFSTWDFGKRPAV